MNMYSLPGHPTIAIGTIMIIQKGLPFCQSSLLSSFIDNSNNIILLLQNYNIIINIIIIVIIIIIIAEIIIVNKTLQMYLNKAFICCTYVFFLPHWKALEKQGAERAQQKAQEKSFTMNSVNTSYTYNQGVGRGLRGRGGGVGPVRGGGYTPGHTRKPYDKPMHAVQQPSPSGPIGAKDFATYPEPLIGELI